MNVERRYHHRQPHELQVHLRYRNRHFSSATGRNISAEGMFLELQNLTLPTGTLIELEFQTPDHNWRLPALVVHHHSGGIGVLFRDPQPQLLGSLDLLSSLPLPPSALTAAPRARALG